jgi:hypothetical protein
MEEKRNAYRVLMGKSERPFGKPNRTWEIIFRLAL